MVNFKNVVAAYMAASAAQDAANVPAGNGALRTSSWAIPQNYTESLELARPLPTTGVADCVVDLGAYDFAFSYGTPYVSQYQGAGACAGKVWDKVVLRFEAYIKGVQFDRTLQIFIGGAEALRGISHEPTRNGIFWKIDEDVTWMSPLLKTPQSVVVVLDIDSTYTGIISSHLTLSFYNSKTGKAPASVPDGVIPLSASKTTYGSFNIVDKTTEAVITNVTLPTNAVDASILFHVSNHQSDEFYYTNVPDNLAIPDYGIYGAGPVKEIQIYIDGQLIAVDWPVPVLYTGGFNPLLWRPIVATGSAVLPTYEFAFTPFLFLLADGKQHTVTLNVTTQSPNRLWFVNADIKYKTSSKATAPPSGKILYSNIPALSPKVDAKVGPQQYDMDITTALDLKTTQFTIVTIAGETKVYSLRKNVILNNRVIYRNDTNYLKGYHNLDVSTTLATFPVPNSVLSLIASPESRSTGLAGAADDASALHILGLSSIPVPTLSISKRTQPFDFTYNYVINPSGGYNATTVLSQNWTFVDSVGLASASIVRKGYYAAGWLGVFNGKSAGLAGTNEYVKVFTPPFSCYSREASAYNGTVRSDKTGGSCF
ncbi:peptide N-acetyl-beta-D-glucosaminyl asparaginase amidase A-domain-containing protein [Cladochytrium replicatum]|nr:peptide N-acetyl-beta-D-glucosaminyl asparaginase amidase A-domain-containing protein [Cladochytrium replicatum]